MVQYKVASYKPPLKEAKQVVLAGVARGETMVSLAAKIGRSPKTFENWRREDRAWARQIDEAREAFKELGDVSDDLDEVAPDRQISFEDFRMKYLNRVTYPHQRAWIQMLEGQLPDEDLPGTAVLRNKKRMILNVPPGHSKSSVITVEYVVYRLCMNPDTHAVIVGKTEQKAQKFLYAIKQRLTDPRWIRLQTTFGPRGGFRQPGSIWNKSMIYIGQPVASEEKDPSVQAIGMKGDLQGARVQLMILDDAVDMQNAHMWEEQKDWLDDIVQSRLFGGRMFIVGTRAAPYDLYAALLDGKNFLSGESSWSHMKQSAVLQFSDEPKDWVTLWPRSNQPFDPDDEESEPGEDGLYECWDGPRLARIRSSISPHKWALLYQQESVAMDAIFKPICVHGSVDGRRAPMPLRAGAWGHPKTGSEGMYTIASMDPAMAGETFIVVGSVSRVDQKRYIENAWVQASPSPEWIRESIKRITDEYQVNEWVIESNAFQLFLVHDPEIRSYLSTRGVKMTPHHTGKNKQDPDFGVASVAPLFGTVRDHVDGGKPMHNKDNLISLPDNTRSRGIEALIEQLLTWEPGKKPKDLKQDGPMALWFWELRAREIIGVARGDGPPQTHVESRFVSRRRKRKRFNVPAHVIESGGFRA